VDIAGPPELVRRILAKLREPTESSGAAQLPA
jgi:hypothetical protein